MTKEEFEKRLFATTNFLIEFTKKNCFNEFSSNIKYVITPNDRNVDSHLNNFEISVLSELNKVHDKHLTSKKAVELLYRSGKVPLWINITVYHTTKRQTIIDLLTSRRLREDSELNHVADQYPPFHPLVPIPPPSLKIERGGKYDINYQRKLRRLMQPKNFKERVQNFLFRKIQRLT